MASAKQIAWRKKFARMSKAGKFKKKSANMKKGMKYFDSQKYADGTPFGKTTKSNPHNDDGYYITKEGSLFVLRQKRFKDRLDRGKKEHPHDVMAYGRTRAEINRMRKSITKS
tara:strand:- start:41 stop:379 length:339 start_codon:yes stop_codon:yes gene_type:complete